MNNIMIDIDSQLKNLKQYLMMTDKEDLLEVFMELAIEDSDKIHEILNAADQVIEGLQDIHGEI